LGRARFSEDTTRKDENQELAPIGKSCAIRRTDNQGSVRFQRAMALWQSLKSTGEHDDSYRQALDSLAASNSPPSERLFDCFAKLAQGHDHDCAFK
jgi:hypothetical protein